MRLEINPNESKKNYPMLLSFGKKTVSYAPQEYGPLAQPVEQLTFNQLVGRSNRPRPTIFQSLLNWGLFYVIKLDSNARPELIRFLLYTLIISAGCL